MATIYWGNWSSDGRFRAGLEIIPNPTSIDAGTGSQLITARVYIESQYSLSEYNFGNNWFLTGSIAASGQTDYNLGAGGTKLMGQANRTVTTSYTGGPTTSVTARIHRNASPGAGLDASVTVNYTTPARPYSPPAPVTGTSSVRNNDGQATVSWGRHYTDGAPYTSQTVQMATLTGSTFGPWVTVANLSAAATSYVETGLSANRIYKFQIRANNTVGSSAWASGGDQVWMTPAAPANVDSSISSSGLQILTTWDERSYQVNPRVTYTIQRSVNGGAWTQVASGLIPTSGSPGAWLDPSPGGGTNQYRVAANTSVGNLTSGFTLGGVVSTVVPPVAPTLLSPNGRNVDLNLPQTLTWQHNPGTDKAKQSGFNIQYSATGGTSWFSLPGASNVNSTVSSFVLPGGTLSNGTAYLWRVQAIGVASAGYGPYSAAATLTGSTTPVVTITSGHPANPTTQMPLDTQWVYQQDEGSPQTQWQAELRSADGTVILESQSGTGEMALVWAYPVQDGVTYLIRVRALSGAGIWSGWAQTSTIINLPPPAATLVTAEYDECAGVMSLHLASADPGPGELPASWATVERRVPGGDWVTLATMMEIPNDLIDPLPSTTGPNEYRITSISSAPSYLINPVVVAAGTDGRLGSPFWVFLSWGAGFSQRLRFRGNPSTGATTGRVRAAQPFLGRRDPVLLLGDTTSRVVSASGSLYFDTACPTVDLDSCRFDSSTTEWETVGMEAGLVAYRDHTGRRLFGMLSDIAVTDAEPGFGAVNFTVTQTAFTEGYTGTGA